MTTQANIPSVERLRFFNGQQLTANDLTDLQRAHRELRWLHNRSLHGWGIGIGLAVTGERGDSAVIVEPGYAVDCLGREIILTELRTITVPSVAIVTTYFLVAGYQPDEAQKVAEQRPGVCTPKGTVRLSEEPRIDWKTVDELQEGIDIVLAQAQIMNCQLNRPLSLAPRRYARPADQPYIAAGQTETGNTAWERLHAGDDRIITTHVETSAARFRTTPYYMAHVVGDRHFISDELSQVILINGISSVVDASPAEFTIQMQIVEPVSTDDLLDIVNNKLQWRVVWMGIEG